VAVTTVSNCQQLRYLTGLSFGKLNVAVQQVHWVMTVQLHGHMLTAACSQECNRGKVSCSGDSSDARMACMCRHSSNR
jgi:hypothetical protein